MKTRVGFTIIEVMIFLAISGLLIMGIILGSGATIARYRYNDSVQNLAELLRQQYSTVVNPQIPTRDKAVLCDSTGGAPQISSFFNGNKGYKEDFYKTLFNSSGKFTGIPGNNTTARGRTNCAIYGTVITLGGANVQTRPLVGLDYAEIEKKYTPSPGGKTFEELSDIELLSLAGIAGGAVYPTAESRTGNPLTLADMQSNNYRCGIALLSGSSSASRSLEWGASVQFPGSGSDNDRKTVMILRSPKDGAIRTYVLNDSLSTSSIELSNGSEYATDGTVFLPFNNGENGKCQGDFLSGGQMNQAEMDYIYNQLSISNKLATEINNIKPEEVVICVASDDAFAYGTSRRMIKIERDGHNSSAVVLVDMDSEDNLCQN